MRGCPILIGLKKVEVSVMRNQLGEVSRTIQYACLCTKTGFFGVGQLEAASRKGLIRIDTIRTRLGEYQGVKYFDYSKCSECKKEDE